MADQEIKDQLEEMMNTVEPGEILETFAEILREKANEIGTDAESYEESARIVDQASSVVIV